MAFEGASKAGFMQKLDSYESVDGENNGASPME